MAYWLMKSEPETYGIHHLAQQTQKTDHWDGIRNYQARNMMRDEMKQGDNAFFYHSNCKIPGIVGTMRISRSAYPDHTAFDPTSKYYDASSDPNHPRWVMVDVTLQTIFPQIISLTALRNIPECAEMTVLRKGNRLSITPVRPSEWRAILDHASSA